MDAALAARSVHNGVMSSVLLFRNGSPLRKLCHRFGGRPTDIESRGVRRFLGMHRRAGTCCTEHNLWAHSWMHVVRLLTRNTVVLCVRVQAQCLVRAVAGYHSATWKWPLLEDLAQRSLTRTHAHKARGGKLDDDADLDTTVYEHNAPTFQCQWCSSYVLPLQ